MPKLKIIVAYTKKDRVIGKGGTIPWALPEDIKQFKEKTLHSVVIMGRETWLSLPNRARPLPQRINIVLSTSLTEVVQRENVYVCRSIEETLDLIPTIRSSLLTAEGRKTQDGVYVIGGQSIYQQFLDKGLVDVVVASEIKEDYIGDRYFPALTGDWKRKLIKNFTEFDLVEYHKG